MAREQRDLLQGTLGLLVLKALAGEERHGYGIAKWIREHSGEILDVPEGSLYPALRRLEDRGLVRSRWDRSETGRRARFYSLTPAGRRHLQEDAGAWSRYATAVSLVLRSDPPAIG